MLWFTQRSSSFDACASRCQYHHRFTVCNIDDHPLCTIAIRLISYDLFYRILLPFKFGNAQIGASTYTLLVVCRSKGQRKSLIFLEFWSSINLEDCILLLWKTVNAILRSSTRKNSWKKRDNHTGRKDCYVIWMKYDKK